MFSIAMVAATLALGPIASGTLRGDATPTSPSSPSASSTRTIDTEQFRIVIPASWEITDQTPWGARDIRPSKGESEVSVGSMSTMTGPGLGRQGWDRLYQTSLFFITRNGRDQTMKPTAYKLGRSAAGFEMCRWDMVERGGNTVQRYAVLKHDNGNILALSVKLPKPDKQGKRDWTERMFERMVDTAVVK